MTASWMVYWFWASQKFNSYFADFWQVKNLLVIPYFFTYWLPKHPVFWFTSLFSTHSVRLPLATYPWLCSTCVTYRTPCHAIGHHLHHIPAFNVISHSSMSYCQVLRPILYFQLSSLQSDSQLCPNPYIRK